jgi:hypothetical protein
MTRTPVAVQLAAAFLMAGLSVAGSVPSAAADPSAPMVNLESDSNAYLHPVASDPSGGPDPAGYQPKLPEERIVVYVPVTHRLNQALLVSLGAIGGATLSGSVLLAGRLRRRHMPRVPA